MVRFAVFFIYKGSGLYYFKPKLKEKRNDNIVKEALDISKKNFPDLLSPPVIQYPEHVGKSYTTIELFIRMIFSALVDGDYLDTEVHFERDLNLIRKSEITLASLWEKFKIHHYKISKNLGELSRLRNEMYQACLDAAESSSGFFRLTMPTGGGKTLSGMAFALKHALKNDFDRVIVAIPYTSIIEQTADVYRRIFGTEAVLEHHSAVTEDFSEEQQSYHNLAAENWDAPIIVTTTVQLFESIFHHKPSRCRKLHNIAKSILVLDEVQTLPTDLLEPILDVLQELVNYYNVTVVLCTATQPALTGGPYLKGLNRVQEIIPDTARYFKALKRVEYRIIPGENAWTWTKVAEEMKNHNQCLTIVNTKKDAMCLLEALNEENALHISTLLCGAHRREVLKEIKRRLGANLPCHVVSTQVVEAGVDIDFPVVMRSIGPLDRIVQAAGRCNREGKLKDARGQAIPGKVIIFTPAEGGLPRGAYRSGTEQTTVILKDKQLNLHNPQLYEQYFEALYGVVNTDVQGIQKLRESLKFTQVSEKFKMINSQTVPVVVHYQPQDTQINILINKIRTNNVINRSLIRELQPYIINIYQNQVTRLLRENYLVELCPGLYEWTGTYDPVCGILEKNRNPEDLIF